MLKFQITAEGLANFELLADKYIPRRDWVIVYSPLFNRSPVCAVHKPYIKEANEVGTLCLDNDEPDFNIIA